MLRSVVSPPIMQVYQEFIRCCSSIELNHSFTFSFCHSNDYDIHDIDESILVAIPMQIPNDLGAGQNIIITDKTISLLLYMQAGS
jgi:hypothetical protein